ncbi:MAG: DUF1573 domain-containing protein [Saprospiraceae bacterium]|nr:DUF1573 domain-containing protein [Saprospiraceae bacterium]HRG68339.1 DUF1573 domain-containing protein [Saprospiraceae bacterium]
MKAAYCKYLIFLTVWGACQKKAELPVNEYDKLIHNPYTAEGQSDSLELPYLIPNISSIDFGTVRQGDTIRQTYVLYNRGKTSLLISKVSSSCGCASPEILKNHLESGDSTLLNIIFTTQDQIGNQEKTFTIYSNTHPAETIVKLKGHVIK